MRPLRYVGRKRGGKGSEEKGRDGEGRGGIGTSYNKEEEG